jgi:hypothetical protein
VNKKDYDTLKAALEKQKREVSSSKAAASAFLKKKGVTHLLVPRGKSAKKLDIKSA